MVAIPVPKTSMNNPVVLFNEDIMADPNIAPELNDPFRSPVLKLFLRGTTHGKPDIVTERTEAYITGWRENVGTNES